MPPAQKLNLRPETPRRRRFRFSRPAILRSRTKPAPPAPEPAESRLYDTDYRWALTGEVVDVRDGQATVVAEGGMFAFAVPAYGMAPGVTVLFVREGDEFVLVRQA